ncbi:hypothetical protein BD311DRAFT_829901 [Dichomitus squalens]|uniref:Uncharacterized protein n=1 Tax=Dichomitus squalens TaxID=114155 RepID=A0A4Q9M7M1_9APHY|nr:hypothetical protein BD311DRAFT_829901 [Dichomitus squalens]
MWHRRPAVPFFYDMMILRDMEELQVLSEDGASADVLAYALHRLVEPDDPYRAIR